MIMVIDILDIDHSPRLKHSYYFRRWICLHIQVDQGKGGPSLVCPLDGAKSVFEAYVSNGPISSVSIPSPFHLNTDALQPPKCCWFSFLGWGSLQCPKFYSWQFNQSFLFVEIEGGRNCKEKQMALRPSSSVFLNLCETVAR